jgi:hypothetical protein
MKAIIIKSITKLYLQVTINEKMGKCSVRVALEGYVSIPQDICFKLHSRVFDNAFNGIRLIFIVIILMGLFKSVSLCKCFIRHRIYIYVRRYY